jgi:hypothetical protein
METYSHSTTYEDREALKKAAWSGKHPNLHVIAIAHWMRCDAGVSIGDYISQWAAARPDGEASDLKQLYPLHGPRKIADDRSDWGSFDDYQADS